MQGVPNTPLEAPKFGASVSFLETFIRLQYQLDRHDAGEPVIVDGHTLSIADVVAAGRYGTAVQLSSSYEVRKRVERSQQTIEAKLASGTSVYGLSTGFGGSADTRTNASLVLGKSLLQHQAAGVLPTPRKTEDGEQEKPKPLPLNDPLSTSMPEAWVRAAILIRMNSLIRGHSGVRWKFIEALGELLSKNITPLVPLRGSISASGVDTEEPSAKPARRIVSSRQAYKEHSISHVTFEAKEHLGLLNGTAFSAATASLALQDVMHVSMLALITTAMGTEALLGAQGSHAPFIHATARPHPGQVEAAAIMHALLDGSSFASVDEEHELKIEEDVGKLRQDRYALRTSPQWLGPLMEDILSAVKQVETECNTTTDNPLVDGETNTVHHGGNFQAMTVSMAMERTRLALQHIGKLLFSQMTEMLNPAFNRGLPPNLAASDPSVNYFGKGLDIGAAAYVSELGWLANPVGTHVQSAEMHNQAVNSLALISARATIQSLEVLTMLIASYILALCQALDIRALQREFDENVQTILTEELEKHFGMHLFPGNISSLSLPTLHSKLMAVIRDTLDATTSMDAVPRMEAIAQACTTPLVNSFIAAVPQPTLSIGPAASAASEPSSPSSPRSATSQVDSTSPASMPTESTDSTIASLTPTAFPSFASNKESPKPASSYLQSTSFSSLAFAATALSALSSLPAFRQSLATRLSALLASLRHAYLSGARGPTPAAPHLSPRTREIYVFVREELKVRMHGWENLSEFDTGFMAQREGSIESKTGAASGELGFLEEEGTVGQNASIIYESIRDGRMQHIVMSIFGAGAGVNAHKDM